MELTYQTRRKLKRGGIIALAALLVLVLVWGCWLVWVERHIVYSRDGAVLDFALTSRDPGEGQLALPPAETEPVSIYYNDGSELGTAELAMRQITGYSITADMLQNDMDTIRATIASLPVGTAVMMEVKSGRGTFYYTTGVEGAYTAKAMDLEAVDQLIADMASRNLYLIASVPAFRDRNFAVEHISSGLPFIGGDGALWVDSGGCYWLDPTDSAFRDYLTKITRELKSLGFDEVLFTEFCFPDTAELYYSGDRVMAIQEAAAILVENCATDRFAVSFLATGSTVKPVAGRSRLYLTGVSATGAETTAAGYSVEDPAVNLVFMTDSYDTRYEICSVIRPMEMAAVNE